MNLEDALRHNQDLTGRTFGSWTVLAPDGQRNGYCLCRCVCGIERSVGRSYLLNGSTRSCGCSRKRKVDAQNDEDLVGKQFGSWTVLYPLRQRHRDGSFVLTPFCPITPSAPQPSAGKLKNTCSLVS